MLKTSVNDTRQIYNACFKNEFVIIFLIDMDTLIIILVIIGIITVLTLTTTLFFLMRKHKEHYLQKRAKNLLIITNQMALKLDKEIRQKDEEITKLMYKSDQSSDEEKEQLEHQIRELKEDINKTMLDLEELRDFKKELEDIIVMHEIEAEEEIERRLDHITSFLRLR